MISLVLQGLQSLIIEGKLCSSSAAILLELNAFEIVYGSCVKVEYIQFSSFSSVLNINLQLSFFWVKLTRVIIGAVKKQMNYFLNFAKILR